MKIVRRLAPLFPFAATFAALALVACAAPAEDEAGEAQGAAKVASKEKADGGAAPSSTAVAAPKELIEPGKYVNFEKGAHLFISGRQEETNQLRTKDGDTIAFGTLGADGRTLRAPEGDVCGSYALSQVPGRLTVDVTWNREGSVASDPEIAKGCSAFEGTYEME